MVSLTKTTHRHPHSRTPRVQPRDQRDQRSGRFRTATVTNEPGILNGHLIHGDWPRRPAASSYNVIRVTMILSESWSFFKIIEYHSRIVSGFWCSAFWNFSREINSQSRVVKKRFTSGDAVTIYTCRTCAGMRDHCERCDGSLEQWSEPPRGVQWAQFRETSTPGEEIPRDITRRRGRPRPRSRRQRRRRRDYSYSGETHEISRTHQAK